MYIMWYMKKIVVTPSYLKDAKKFCFLSNIVTYIYFNINYLTPCFGLSFGIISVNFYVKRPHEKNRAAQHFIKLKKLAERPSLF